MNRRIWNLGFYHNLFLCWLHSFVLKHILRIIVLRTIYDLMSNVSTNMIGIHQKPLYSAIHIFANLFWLFTWPSLLTHLPLHDHMMWCSSLSKFVHTMLETLPKPLYPNMWTLQLVP
jgi:hypothetical protein